MDIVVNNLNKKYGDKIILDNYYEVFKNNTISFIMGPSGVGKTTLIRILMGLEKADSGEVTGMEDKKISAVFQEDSLCRNLSVYLNIKLVNEDISDIEIENALKQMDLYDYMYKRVDELSGGMKRKVAILRAILCDFDLLIMDEPFKGLDTETKSKVMSYLINNLKNKTAIIITHNIDEVKYFEDSKEITTIHKMLDNY